MDTLLQDARYAVRSLTRAPLLLSITVLTLALGIGANSAIYSIVRGVLLQPLPYADEERLVMLWRGTDRGETTWISLAEYVDYRAEVDSFADVAVVTDAAMNLTGDGEPQRVGVFGVTGNTFEVLGVEAALGRALLPADGAPEAGLVVVISDGLFRNRFGSDPALIGSTIRLDGTPRTVVGVMPPRFRIPLEYRSGLRTHVWLPLQFDPADPGSRGNRSYHAIGRVAPGATLDQARQELAALHGRWHDEGLLPEDYAGPGLLRIRELLFGDARPLLALITGAAGFVLLICCANVASLMLARGEGRRTEMGVRLALGAPRQRVLRLALMESAVAAVLGGAVGIGVGALIVRLVRTAAPSYLPRITAIALDGSVVAYTVAISVVTGLLFGVLPALQASRGDSAGVLHAGGRSRTQSLAARSSRRALVIGEISLAVALTIVAVLTVRSFANLRAIEPGFDADGVLTMRVELPRTTYAEEADRLRFFEAAVDGLEALPRVESAGAARVLPLAAIIGNWSITIEGREPPTGNWPQGDFQVVMPGYFETMGIRLVSGRFLSPDDRADTLPAVVINQTMAQTYWPDGDALGSRFRIGNEATPWYAIVGITADVRRNSITEEPRTEMYHAAAQWDLAATIPRGMTLVLRTTADPLDLAEPARAVVAEIDPELPVSDIRAMSAVVADATSNSRFLTQILAALGAVAVLLAAVGIYGVITYSVRRRTREIGIRIAIGADRRRVVRGVLGEGLALLAVGAPLGVLVAAASTGLLSSFLYGVSGSDPASMATVVVAVSIVTAVASYAPARRAASVDPAIAFRDEDA